MVAWFFETGWWVTIGIFVAWWFLPQPEWAKELLVNIKGYFNK